MSSLFGGSQTGVREQQPYGGLPYQLAGEIGGAQLNPLIRGLGFGGGQRFGRFEQQLAGAQGPLADLIRGIQGYAGTVTPEATAAGNQVSAQGSAAYQQAQAQIQQALGALPQYQEAANQGLGYAQDFARSAFDPTTSQPLYLEASRQLLDTIRPGLAARGIASAGAGQQAETDASRQLADQFAQRQQAMQQAAIPQLQQAAGGAQQLSQAGVPLAQQGMQDVQQLGQFLEARYGIPMQASAALMNLLTGGQQGGLALLGATGPQFTPASKSSGIGGGGVGIR